MFLSLLYELRSRGVPVGTTEAIQLARALAAELHASSLEGFYDVSRSLLIHDEKHLDDFDQAFAKVFRGVHSEAKSLKDELLEWLAAAKRRAPELSDEERALLENLDPEALRRRFEELLEEQNERHDGGNRWIGTGGTSPFGNAGVPRPGFRVGGSGGGRSAIAVAGARRFAAYRNDVSLDVRQLSLALRKLRAFTREGAEDELDLDASIDATAKNAGELEVVVRPPRRSNTRVILLMDVGGSMDPHALLMSRLFTAATKSRHFRELRTYYFHNCVYGKVYEDAGFTRGVRVRDLLADCGPHYKLIVVGDALMAPYELLSGGSDVFAGEDRVEGIVWLMMLEDHFHRACWLNPEPRRYWSGNTIEYIAGVFEMFPLTIDGLGEAARHLSRRR